MRNLPSSAKTKITESQAVEIYNRVLSGESRRSVSSSFVIGHNTMANILNGTLFPHLNLEPIIYKGLNVMSRYKPMLERLMERTVKNIDSGCWEWVGSVNEDGYGRFKSKDKTRRVHRVSYEVHVGPIPAGLQVLHHCDNPRCINPDHLFIGTHDDNMRDRDAKLRMARGSSIGGAKITEDLAVDIVSSFNSGEKVRDISSRIDMKKQTIRAVIRGDYWSHVTGVKKKTVSSD